MSLSVAQVLYLHDLALKYGGGSPGVRDLGLIESALGSASQTWEGQFLHATPPSRAAAVAHALVSNHPFVDGNKRTGFLAMALWLAAEGMRFESGEQDAVATFFQIAAGAMDRGAFIAWVTSHSLPDN